MGHKAADFAKALKSSAALAPTSSLAEAATETSTTVPKVIAAHDYEVVTVDTIFGVAEKTQCTLRIGTYAIALLHRNRHKNAY
eukprot:SAG31_NODE_1871_length_7025_cov_10.081144_3_plen_83_part_00